MPHGRRGREIIRGLRARVAELERQLDLMLTQPGQLLQHEARVRHQAQEDARLYTRERPSVLPCSLPGGCQVQVDRDPEYGIVTLRHGDYATSYPEEAARQYPGTYRDAMEYLLHEAHLRGQANVAAPTTPGVHPARQTYHIPHIPSLTARTRDVHPNPDFDIAAWWSRERQLREAESSEYTSDAMTARTRERTPPSESQAVWSDLTTVDFEASARILDDLREQIMAAQTPEIVVNPGQGGALPRGYPEQEEGPDAVALNLVKEQLGEDAPDLIRHGTYHVRSQLNTGITYRCDFGTVRLARLIGQEGFDWEFCLQSQGGYPFWDNVLSRILMLTYDEIGFLKQAFCPPATAGGHPITRRQVREIYGAEALRKMEEDARPWPDLERSRSSTAPATPRSPGPLPESAFGGMTLHLPMTMGQGQFERESETTVSADAFIPEIWGRLWRETALQNFRLTPRLRRQR